MMRWKQKGKKLAVLFFACLLMFAEAFPLQNGLQAQAKKQAFAKTARQTSGIHVAYHSIDDIRSYVQQNGATLTEPLVFAKDPVAAVPYDPGKLSDRTQQSALDMLRQIRYIAGISDQVQLSDRLCTYAQAGAFLNYVNGQLSHTPERPSGMDDALYSAGAKGAGESNMAKAWGGRSLNETIALSWMQDGSGHNLTCVGHRRWLLNPKMGYTGFGAAGDAGVTYSSAYALDESNASASETGVTWPAQNTPTEYFPISFPWSISLNHAVNKSAVQVKLTRLSDQKEWNFSSSSSDGDFYVDNDTYSYGLPGCIIFRPSLTDFNGYEDGDSYQVTVTGDREPISYTVNFFDLITLEGISAEYKGGPVEENGTINQNQIVVTGRYSDGSTKKITDFTVRPYTIKAGSNDITVVYKNQTSVVKVPGKAKKITIQFDAAGGSSVSACSVEKGSVLAQLPKTTRNGYQFEGWYTAKEGGTKLEETTVLERDTTYYAHWKAIELSSISAEYDGVRIIAGTDHEFEPDDFYVVATYTDGSKWVVRNYTIDNHTIVAGENTLTIRYNGKSATVKVNAVSVERFGIIYVGGWKMEGTTELDDMDVRLHVTLSDGDVITIKYPGCSVDPFVIKPGVNILTVRFGGKSGTFEVNGEATNRPDTQLVTIQFQAQGGSTVSGRRVPKGSAVGTLPEPVRTGYTLEGWFTQAEGGTQITPATVVSADVTYYAHWMVKSEPDRPDTPDRPQTPDRPDTPDHPQIPDQPDTPDNPQAPDQPDTPDNPQAPDQPDTPDQPQTPSVPDNPDRPNGNQPQTPSASVTVRFDAQGGENVPSIRVSKDEKLSYIPLTRRPGWTFQGWYTEKNGAGSMLTLGTVLQQDTVYYAYWTAEGRTVAGLHVSMQGIAYAGENVRHILAVSVLYSDGMTERVYDYMVSQETLQEGSNLILVTRGGYSKSIQIQTGAGTTSANISNLRVRYSGGEVPVGTYSVFGGLTVTAVYSDGTEKTVEDYVLSNNTIRQGNNTVTVHYAGKTADFQVTGYQQSIIRVNAPGALDIWVAQEADLSSVLKDFYPDRSGYQFAGWYLDEGCTQKVRAGTGASNGMRIYAKWQKLYNWKLNKSKATVTQGKTVKLFVRGLGSTKVSWKTSNKKVATVSKKGVVKAKKAGTAMIAAVTRDGSVMTCKVTVRKKAKKR